MVKEIQKTLKIPEYCSKAGLKHRGWTDKAIELFLKIPDKEAKNPHYKSAPAMKLYLIKRVEKIERSKKFQDFQNNNAKRVKSARKTVITKKQRLLKEVMEWHIHIEKKEYQNVIKNAIRSYNNFKESIAYERGNFDFKPATSNSDTEFLERITVNYLRHNLSNYDQKLERIFGKVGKSEAYEILNRKIYEMIADVYPQLKSECDKQMLRKQTEQNYY